MNIVLLSWCHGHVRIEAIFNIDHFIIDGRNLQLFLVVKRHDSLSL